jgi:hypothetical protein
VLTGTCITIRGCCGAAVLPKKELWSEREHRQACGRPCLRERGWWRDEDIAHGQASG